MLAYGTLSAGGSPTTVLALFCNKGKGELECSAAACRARRPIRSPTLPLPSPLASRSDVCPAPGDHTSCRVYVAQEGDSLASIAIAFSVNIAELQEVNPTLATVGDTVAVLQPGQRINIPPFTAACGEGECLPTSCSCSCSFSRAHSSAVLAMPTRGKHARCVPPPCSCPGVTVAKPVSGNCYGYIVQAGDTLFSIATMVRT